MSRLKSKELKIAFIKENIDAFVHFEGNKKWLAEKAREELKYSEHTLWQDIANSLHHLYKREFL